LEDLPQMTKGHVLYVEDHADTSILMTFLLEQAGFTVTATSTGEECLQLVQNQDFDLYLLDHTFPDASGVSICIAIREIDKDTPIIFYSARAFSKEIEEAIKCGAQAYLVKPHDIFNVATHVEEWINKKRAYE
jgi:CheY-like chemotaxis protein